MSNAKLSLMFLLSYDQYSSVLVLELMILAMFLAFDPICFIVHIVFVFRSRTKFRMMVHRSCDSAQVLACRSVGSESRGDLGVSHMREHGARVYEDR